jgi:translation elongation factor EF-1beta
LTPPNIGLQKAFTDYIIKENNEKRTPNLAFLKIIPFLMPGRSSITYDGIKAKVKEFEEMDDISFQFLNSAVSKMTFGIKELKKTCECGEEVRTDMQFPTGASGIFVIHDAFEAYIKE